GVLQALGTSLAHGGKDPAGAIRALRHLLEVAPETRSDQTVQQALLDLANGPAAETATEAFDVIRNQMGSVGPDLVFELAQNATRKYAKEHAPAALDDAALMKAASPGLLIADELRRKTPCARKGSVPKAAAEGDARALPFLRQMVATRPCGGIAALFRGGECPPLACRNPPDRAAVGAPISPIAQ